MTPIVGLDLSLTSTGWATYIDGKLTMGRIKGGKLTGRERRTHIGITVANLVRGIAQVWPLNPLPLVVIEAVPTHGYAYNVVKLAELHGVVIDHLAPYRPAYVDPSTLKKWATGKGNAGKPAMLQAAQAELGYEGKSSDEADAAWLVMVGRHLTGARGPMFTTQRLSLLGSVSWPEGLAPLDATALDAYCQGTTDPLATP